MTCSEAAVMVGNEGDDDDQTGSNIVSSCQKSHVTDDGGDEGSHSKNFDNAADPGYSAAINDDIIFHHANFIELNISRILHMNVKITENSSKTLLSIMSHQRCFLKDMARH